MSREATARAAPHRHTQHFWGCCSRVESLVASPAPPAGATTGPPTEKCWRTAGCTHVHHLLSVLVDGGEVWSGAVSLVKQTTAKVSVSCDPREGPGGTEALTLTYCTLKSSAPASTEELMRHRGCPPTSETAESHRHLHLLSTPTSAQVHHPNRSQL